VLLSLFRHRGVRNRPVNLGTPMPGRRKVCPATWSDAALVPISE
jgi:hypothetical protein